MSHISASVITRLGVVEQHEEELGAALVSNSFNESYVTIHHETSVKSPLGHFQFVISRKYMS